MLKVLKVGLFTVSAAVVIAGSGSVASAATTLSAALNVDNGFAAYISTDDSVAGTEFSDGNNWQTTVFANSAMLTPGVVHYLHILATDAGYLAGLLGEFTLSDASFEFANGTQTMLSGDAGLSVSNSGWGSYDATVSYGTNGVSPWGQRILNNANSEWVWTETNAIGGPIDTPVYFSAVINPVTANVPVPAALPLLIGGLGMLGWVRRRT